MTSVGIGGDGDGDETKKNRSGEITSLLTINHIPTLSLDRPFDPLLDNTLQDAESGHGSEVYTLHLCRKLLPLNFGSPSIFARILDKGGHLSITPSESYSTKENYLQSSNIPHEVTSSLVIRGHLSLVMQYAPAFDYAQSSHQTTIIGDPSAVNKNQKMAHF
ncbi:hypothetical protein L218DRAFT_949423 [Marasmius fiardii PR-910]|nr:hypothetical protein L218DRAFT_949423 [Marasmius fiardii PR-910]